LFIYIAKKKFFLAPAIRDAINVKEAFLICIYRTSTLISTVIDNALLRAIHASIDGKTMANHANKRTDALFSTSWSCRLLSIRAVKRFSEPSCCMLLLFFERKCFVITLLILFYLLYLYVISIIWNNNNVNFFMIMSMLFQFIGITLKSKNEK